MARRRSILGDLWLQLSLQAALAVTAAHAAAAAESVYAQQVFLSAPADDAFVYTGAALESAIAQPQQPSFEDFSLSFYLPPGPRDANEYVMLPDLDAALLGGPERTYDWHADDFLL
ncbi:hypothetical protein [Terricaulis silvestris]|uniref:Uncharacterized protein n=1 Tax=Terricaulis silvestris TaxID=2686094 RepID=A0A6I6MKB2_9CAUL|nr:hypothetical protein [Terricaulis silvestris]QGZ95745.1 hypothetical protein DSM104635_02596 [Terricaulis silvestris]